MSNHSIDTDSNHCEAEAAAVASVTEALAPVAGGGATLSPAELKSLKEKLRNSLWTSDAVLREIALIQKLRVLYPPRD